MRSIIYTERHTHTKKFENIKMEKGKGIVINCKQRKVGEYLQGKARYVEGGDALLLCFIRK